MQSLYADIIVHGTAASEYNNYTSKNHYFQSLRFQITDCKVMNCSVSDLNLVTGLTRM